MPTRQSAGDDRRGPPARAVDITPAGFIQAALAADNANVTDRYYGRQNRTVKVVGFTTKVCDGPQPQLHPPRHRRVQ